MLALTAVGLGAYVSAHLSGRGSVVGRSVSAPLSGRGSVVGRGAISASASTHEEVDIVVIGSGIAGLSCGALLASRGEQVAVLEQHYEVGGCAHAFTVGMDGRTVPSARLAKEPETPVFHFEAGPSLYSGLSPSGSPNPLKHIYQMIGEAPEWITYDTWGAHLPEVPQGYELSIGADNFLEILRRYGGESAVSDWEKLSSELRPLSKGVMALPSTAVRGDLGILLTLALRYPLAFGAVIRDLSKIVSPFDLESLGVKDAFLKNYLDLIAFLLQGLPANQTLTAVMAYMVEDFYREGAVMDFPKGGSGELVGALARGVKKHEGCSVRTSTAVEEILVEEGRAVGVRLKGGKELRARKAVVSNADLYNTFALLPEGKHAALDVERERLLSSNLRMLGEATGAGDGEAPLCKSFMHLHLGIRAEGLDELPPQWTVVNDWDVGIDAPGNVIVVSMPSKLDPGLAPPGYHVIHAYGAGNEPWAPWERFAGPDGMEGDDTRTNGEYQKLKAERAAPLWEAIKRRIPDVDDRIVIEQVGPPPSHPPTPP